MIIIKLLLIVIIAICVKLIYDAREICEKYFSSSMKNKQVTLIKITGFAVGIICTIIFGIIA